MILLLPYNTLILNLVIFLFWNHSLILMIDWPILSHRWYYHLYMIVTNSILTWGSLYLWHLILVLYWKWWGSLYWWTYINTWIWLACWRRLHWDLLYHWLNYLVGLRWLNKVLIGSNILWLKHLCDLRIPVYYWQLFWW